MDALNFVYWLQGHLEIGNPQGLSLEQVNIIKDHIALVLEKKTFPYNIGSIEIDPVVCQATGVNETLLHMRHMGSC